MGTTDDRGLTFEYHAEQHRRGALVPEHGRRVTNGFVYGGDGTPIDAQPLPSGVSTTQGCVLAFTASPATEVPDNDLMFSIGRVTLGSSRGLIVGFSTIGAFSVQLQDWDTSTFIGFEYPFLKSVKVNQVARFAVAVRPSDPSAAIAAWINGKLIATVPRGPFSFANPWIGHPSWYGLRDSGQVRLLYRQQPDQTDLVARPQIDYYLGSPSLVGKRGRRY